MLAELRGTAGGKKGETFRQIETIIANMERWFASEFLRGDRIIMRPQWRRSARWKDDARHYPAASLNSLMITR